MSKFVFSHEGYGVKITHEIEEIQLHEVIGKFEEFLRGCGFYFNGHIDIVCDDDNEASLNQLLLE